MTINGIRYFPNQIILYVINDDGLRFGKITKIYDVDNSIFFQFNNFENIGFNEHYYAYSVLETNVSGTLNQKDIFLKLPCVHFKRSLPDNFEEKILYIALKHN